MPPQCRSQPYGHTSERNTASPSRDVEHYRQRLTEAENTIEFLRAEAALLEARNTNLDGVAMEAIADIERMTADAQHALRLEWRDRVIDSLQNELRPLVEEQLRNEMIGVLRAELRPVVEQAVRNEAIDEIRTELRPQIELRNQNTSAVGQEVKDELLTDTEGNSSNDAQASSKEVAQGDRARPSASPVEFTQQRVKHESLSPRGRYARLQSIIKSASSPSNRSNHSGKRSRSSSSLETITDSDEEKYEAGRKRQRSHPSSPSSSACSSHSLKRSRSSSGLGVVNDDDVEKYEASRKRQRSIPSPLTHSKVLRALQDVGSGYEADRSSETLEGDRIRRLGSPLQLKPLTRQRGQRTRVSSPRMSFSRVLRYGSPSPSSSEVESRGVKEEEQSESEYRSATPSEAESGGVKEEERSEDEDHSATPSEVESEEVKEEEQSEGGRRSAAPSDVESRAAKEEEQSESEYCSATPSEAESGGVKEERSESECRLATPSEAESEGFKEEERSEDGYCSATPSEAESGRVKEEERSEDEGSSATPSEAESGGIKEEERSEDGYRSAASSDVESGGVKEEERSESGRRSAAASAAQPQGFEIWNDADDSDEAGDSAADESSAGPSDKENNKSHRVPFAYLQHGEYAWVTNYLPPLNNAMSAARDAGTSMAGPVFTAKYLEDSEEEETEGESMARPIDLTEEDPEIKEEEEREGSSRALAIDLTHEDSRSESSYHAGPAKAVPVQAITIDDIEDYTLRSRVRQVIDIIPDCAVGAARDALVYTRFSVNDALELLSVITGQSQDSLLGPCQGQSPESRSSSPSLEIENKYDPESRETESANDDRSPLVDSNEGSAEGSFFDEALWTSNNCVEFVDDRYQPYALETPGRNPFQ